ncbi:MAG: hypothetical protein R3F56_06585 [Planctomycetota bacterium]
MSRRALFVPLLTALGPLTPGRGQVPLGHAVVAGAASASAPALWEYEPLRSTLVPLDTRAMPTPFQVSALHVLRGGARVLLAGAPPGNTDDSVLAAAVSSQAIGTPQVFAQGFRGRMLALFTVAALTEVVYVTEHGIFATAASGGTARSLTSSTTSLGATDAILVAPATVVVGAVDTLGQAILWQLDLNSMQLGSRPLRLAGRVSLATGPLLGTALLAETSGQIWLLDLQTLVRTPWLNVGRSPLRDLWSYGDQHAWFAAVGTDVVRISAQGVGQPVPLPPAGAQDLDYRAYESEVVAYGSACRGSALRLADVGWQGRPVPGNDTFALTVGNARANTPVAMMVGAAATSIPLDVFGMPTCVAWTQPLVSIAAATTAIGAAQVPFAIPADPALAGAALFVQWLIVDPGANVVSLVVSNGAAVRI